MEATQDPQPVYRIVFDTLNTRYAELSIEYDEDSAWHDAIKRIEAAFDGDRVTLYRLHSEETPTRLVLTQEETLLLSLAAADYHLDKGSVGEYCYNVAVLDAAIVTYTAYLEALKSASQRAYASQETALNPLADLDDHPF